MIKEDKKIKNEMEDKNLITKLEVVNEMYARKIEFLPIDLEICS